MDTYLGLSDVILRADIIRYPALLKDGGVYMDLDVGCNRPIDLWIPPTFKDDTSAALGIEADNDFGKEGNKLFSFVNWTLMARRDQPFMRYLVHRVIRNLHQAASKHNTTLGDLRLCRQEVLDATGPGALTQTAFQYLSDKTQTTVTAQNFTKMKRPRLVDGNLVLPINVLGAGHQVQWSGADEDGSALVHHYLAGSWKGSHSEGPTEEESEKTTEEEKKKEEAIRKEEEEKNQEEKEEEGKRKEKRRERRSRMKREQSKRSSRRWKRNIIQLKRSARAQKRKQLQSLVHPGETGQQYQTL